MKKKSSLKKILYLKTEPLLLIVAMVFFGLLSSATHAQVTGPYYVTVYDTPSGSDESYAALTTTDIATFPAGTNFYEAGTFDYANYQNTSNSLNTDFYEQNKVDIPSQPNYVSIATLTDSDWYAFRFTKTITADEVGVYSFTRDGRVDNFGNIYLNDALVYASENDAWQTTSGTDVSGLSLVEGDKLEFLVFEATGNKSYLTYIACLSANAGTPSGTPISACSEVEESTLLSDLTDAQSGGAWTDSSGGSVTFPITVSDTYTYTVIGDCDSDSADVVVAITGTVNPGTPSGNPVVSCSNVGVTELDLLNDLTGEDAGGNWTDSADVDVVFPITVSGTYTYTVTGTPPCNDESVNVVVDIITAPEAGTPSGTALVACSDVGITAQNLLDDLTGEDAGGIWTDSALVPVAFPITVSGTYSYTVLGVSPCANDTADVVVDIVLAPEAGTPSGNPVVSCSNTGATEAELFGDLSDAQTGGVWTTSIGGTVSFPITQAGIYTYTVQGTVPCAEDTAEVEVAISTIDTDGDGVIDCDELLPPSGGTPTDINDPCSFIIADRTVVESGDYLVVDCDGDGVTNGNEMSSLTDPNDFCDYILADRTLPVSVDYQAADCDLDGNINSTDPNPKVPTAFNDMLSVPYNGTETVNILENDDFLPIANTSITQVGGTGTGIVLFDATTGEMSYTPVSDGSETDSTVTVMYQVCYDSGVMTCETATVTIEVSSDELDLSIEQSVLGGDLTPNIGTDFTLELVVTNSSSDLSATNVEVTDVLPSGYVFVSSDTPQGSYDDGSGLWTIGEIMPGESVSLTITVATIEDGDYLNCAYISYLDQTDTDSSNDESCVEVIPFIDIVVPDGFTPNGDGKNDLFVIANLAEFYPNFTLEIVNRWGNSVYKYKHNGDPNSTPDWWDGVSTGQLNLSNGTLPTGSYFYTIEFNDNEREPLTSYVYLRK